VLNKAVVLCVLAVALAGCGRTYSVAQVRGALAGAGVVVERVGTYPRNCPGPSEPFPSPAWVLEQFTFDPPAGVRPLQVIDVAGGVVMLFCGTHDAWFVQEVFFPRARAELLDEIRHPVEGLLGAENTVLLREHEVRRGNVLFVEIGRQPRLDDAAARLP